MARLRNLSRSANGVFILAPARAARPGKLKPACTNWNAKAFDSGGESRQHRDIVRIARNPRQGGAPAGPASAAHAPHKDAPAKGHPGGGERSGGERCGSDLGGDLVQASGGRVQGEHCGPAFSYAGPHSMPLPVLIAVPHAGRAYPAQVLEALRDRHLCQLRLEDRFVDALGLEIARQTGTGLLIAHAPRAMLDLNRAADDIDWEMIEGARRPARGKARGPSLASSNARARSGLGLVPRRLPGFGEIWRGPMARSELDRRIDEIHRPYHDFLSAELERIRAAWGAALLIDLHSMPPLRCQPGQVRAPQLVLGDRFGASCEGPLVARAMQVLEGSGIETAHNRPYSGGYVLDRHAAPSRRVHALQLEVCRRTYLDEALSEPSAALPTLARCLAGLVRELGAHTARLADRGQLSQAAE